MESKQEHLVFAADPEIQLALLLCKKTLGVKARVYKIGWGGGLKNIKDILEYVFTTWQSLWRKQGLELKC